MDAEKIPEYYASLTSMPKNKWEQDQASQILHEAQLEFVQASISSSVSTGKLDDPPVEVDGWLYDETRYNEETLKKVNAAFEEAFKEVTGTEWGVELMSRDLISKLQNAGILFRERLG